MILLDEYRRKAQQKSTLFSDNPRKVQKPDLGLPVQVSPSFFSSYKHFIS